MPKGLRDKIDDSPLDTAKRELTEETGIDIDKYPYTVFDMGKEPYIYKPKQIHGFLFIVDDPIKKDLVCCTTFYSGIPEIDKWIWVNWYIGMEFMRKEQVQLLQKFKTTINEHRRR